MNFVKLYTRVLTLLGPEARLGWVLAGANVALAAAQFAKPVLFGRIIDALVKGQTSGATPTFEALTPLLAAWVGFGLFTIACSVLVALHADRLSHRRKQSITTMYFEHVLQLPLSFHGGSHSGRLMKVMLTGVDALWMLWLSFFREHFAAFVALFVLLPLSLFVNWRLASLLILLCFVFSALIILVLRKKDTEKLLGSRQFNRVSRIHCEIEYLACGQVEIRDLSRNGTLVDGVRVGRSQLVSVGPSRVVVELVDGTWGKILLSEFESPRDENTAP